MPFERELEVALDAARLAGERIRADYEAFVPIPDAPASITTETDRASQELVLRRLREAFPADGLCAEEATESARTAAPSGGRVWVVDPIDGTRGFVMKNGEFSVMIGLRTGDGLAVGVVLEPALGRVTYATAGGGCWVRSGDGPAEPCRVTQTESLADATLVQSHAKPGTRSEGQRFLHPKRIAETYSAGVKLAMVARGEVDLYLNTYRNFSDWDICAGHLLVVEAGGTVSEVTGGPVAYGKPGFAQRGGLLADNGRLHADALKRLEALGWA